MVTLVKKINGTFKSKLKTHTPINIAIPKHLADQIKKFPRLSLEAMKENRGTSKDWYNLMFRTKIGLDIACAVYTEEASKPMADIFNICLNMKDRFLAENKWYITESEYEDLLAGLDATDQMQDETTRRLQVDIFKNSDLYIKKLIKSINGFKEETT